ncbi:MAG: hypothetical protein IKF82_00065 [Bacilli bacterium]|nr:hypothetical protein [Bacilli bacterium]
MTIKNTITSIKQYFLKWHQENYANIHEAFPGTLSSWGNDNYDLDKLVQKQAILDRINQLDNKIQTNLGNENYTYPNAKFKTTQTYDISDPLKVGFDFMVNPDQCKDGLMTWQDKMDLNYVKRWKKFEGRNISQGQDRSPYADYLTIWVNPTLRMVHCYINTEQFKELGQYLRNELRDCEGKKYSERTEDIHPTLRLYPFNFNNKEQELFWNIKPMSPVWIPTNNTNKYGLHIGFGKQTGIMYFRVSNDPTTLNLIKSYNSISVEASLFWLYDPEGDKGYPSYRSKHETDTE